MNEVHWLIPYPCPLEAEEAQRLRDRELDELRANLNAAQARYDELLKAPLPTTKTGYREIQEGEDPAKLVPVFDAPFKDFRSPFMSLIPKGVFPS